MLRRIGRRLVRVGIRRWQTILLCLLLVGLGLPLPTQSDAPQCAAPARLSVGSTARTSYDPADQPSMVRLLRDFPGDDAPARGSVPPGATLTVLQGPECERGVSWWEVQTLSGESGWTPETQANLPGNRYVLEPWQRLVDLTRPIPDGVAPTGIALLRINLHGLGRWLTAFTPPVLANEGMEAFPDAEAAPLRQAFVNVQQNCPARAGWVDLPAADAIRAFPSPDSTRLLLVRHWWRSVTLCDGTTTPRYGIDRLSLTDTYGDRLLFDLPAHADLTGTADNATANTDPPNRVIDVRWSPDNIHALAWLRYGERSRLLVIDTYSGALTLLDDGADPAWSPDGSRISWLRADGLVTNLISDSPDRLVTVGADRQTLTLPSTLQYTGAALDPAWDSDGSRLVACVRADGCASVAVIDVPMRRTLPALTVPAGAALAVRWVLADSALLWLPRAGGNLIMQAISDGMLRTFTLNLAEGEHISNVYPFPGGDSVLIVIQSVTDVGHYVVLDLTSGALSTVTFSAP